MKKVLILCTGNSCRSKMVQACLQHLDAELCVRSAGTYPAPQVHPLAIEVMKEICSRTMSRTISTIRGMPSSQSVTMPARRVLYSPER